MNHFVRGMCESSKIVPTVAENCLRHFPHFKTMDCILTGLIVGIAGQLGDLSLSVLKRDLGIKDMGVVIRGHGGILDRIDSLIYVAPLFFHVTRYFHGIY